MEVIIGSTKDEKYSDEIEVLEHNGYQYPSFPVTIWAWNLVEGEAVNIQFPTDVDGEWETVEVLNIDSKSVSLGSPASFRIYKPATSENVGVAMSALRMRFSKSPY